MARKGSRTYKLRLSPHGVDLFLACHYRLARLAREFIPYGMTLTVAVALLDRLGANDFAAELETVACDRLAGDLVRFVGCSTGLAEVVQRICERLAASDQLGHSPAIGRLYIVGLVAFGLAEDDELMAAYRSAVSRKPGCQNEDLTGSEKIAPAQK